MLKAKSWDFGSQQMCMLFGRTGSRLRPVLPAKISTEQDSGVFEWSSHIQHTSISNKCLSTVSKQRREKSGEIRQASAFAEQAAPNVCEIQGIML